MSVLLADIDATCAALGYDDGIKYQADPDAIQGLKVGPSTNAKQRAMNSCEIPVFLALNLDTSPGFGQS